MDNENYKGPKDESTIYLNHDAEVKWWATQLGVSVIALKEAVSKVGNSASKVKDYLKENKHQSR
jgi:hypothetical protein